MFFIYSTIIFAPFSLFSHITFVILLFGLSFSVSLRCETGSLGPGYLPLCYGMWPYCHQFPILLPPPDRAFSVSQCHSLKSSGGYFSSFGIDSSRARFASSSAFSFAVIRACPGTQHSVTFPFRLSMCCLIFLVFGFFVWLFPDAAIMVLSTTPL
jgi:hypothetical protein